MSIAKDIENRAATKTFGSILKTEEMILELLFKIARLAQEDVFSNMLAHDFAHRIENLTFQRIMTRKEVATFLSVSIRTIDRWVAHEGLPSYFRQISPGKRFQRVFLMEDTLEWHERRLTSFPAHRES